MTKWFARIWLLTVLAVAVFTLSRRFIADIGAIGGFMNAVVSEEMRRFLGTVAFSAITVWAMVKGLQFNPTSRQSSSPAERGPESAHSGKQNTADESELLPTQLPKEKMND